jgi:dihydrofolate reductase
MTKLRVHSFGISVDGYGAGPNQDLANPLGAGGTAMHEWAFATRTFQRIHGREGGATGIDDDFMARGFAQIGAWIIGRNMFGPIRGPWPDDTWKGWWGDNPPFHTPVFVLTHYPRPSITMDGGTVFHFVADGINAALTRATEAAHGQDIRLGFIPETPRRGNAKTKGVFSALQYRRFLLFCKPLARLVGAGLALPSCPTPYKLRGQGKPSPHETCWLRLRRPASPRLGGEMGIFHSFLRCGLRFFGRVENWRAVPEMPLRRAWSWATQAVISCR